MRQLIILVNIALGVGTMSVQQDALEASVSEFYRKRGLMAILADGIGGFKTAMNVGEEMDLKHCSWRTKQWRIRPLTTRISPRYPRKAS